jgi:ubiquinone/menaquinone biosynthesis C-methylase UbiE
MDKPMSNFHFRFMSLGFWFRDTFLPPKNILKEAGIKPGFSVLDYGCGPGGYSIAAAGIVGDSGKVYALDVHPLAVRMVQDTARKRGLTNVKTILSDCGTGLPDDSIDIVLLYDTLHILNDPGGVLEEIHRVLRPKGILSISDHHMTKDEITSRTTAKDLFSLSGKVEIKGIGIYSYLKI